MSSNTRVTRSKGQPEAVSLPARTRQSGKSTNTSDQHPVSLAHGLGQLQPDTPVQTSALSSQSQRPTPSQSITGPTAGVRPPSSASSVMDTIENRAQPTPPLASANRMQETPVPTAPSTLPRPLMPRVQLPNSQFSGSHLSQLSGPLFTEDQYSTSSGSDQESCDAEVDHITHHKTPPKASTIPILPGRPTPDTVDYSTQGDLDQAAPQNEHSPREFHGTNNYLIPDGTDCCIHDIQKKTFLPGHLENGNNAYLVELPDLKEMLRTERFLMDKMSGQFYAIYGNSYQCMSTHPRLNALWEKAELLDELTETRCTFRYAGLAGPTPAQQIPQPVHQQQTPQVPTKDIIPGLTPAKIPPRSIPYQPPAFSLDRPTARLTMEQRMQVYHNYISAVFNLEHKKDIINRLKRVEPHNIPTYEAKMTRHLKLHEDVLGRLLTNLKQDDYFRSLEDLPTIDGLQAYDDVRLFPELYDTTAVIERITSEVDLIKRQLKRPGMYPLPSTPLPSVSGFAPRPSPTFKPISPKGQPTVTSPRSSDQPQKDDGTGTSPGNSLPCGQGMPQDPPSSTNESPSWSPQCSPQQVLPQPNPPTNDTLWWITN